MPNSDEAYVDKQLTCVRCGWTFTFRAREQIYYTEMAFKMPRRCKACREEQRASRAMSQGPDGPGRDAR